MVVLTLISFTHGNMETRIFQFKTPLKDIEKGLALQIIE